MIYLDNAMTSYPKPPRVLSRVAETLASPPFDPERSAGTGPDVLVECRQRLARLLGLRDPDRVLLSPGATHSLSRALRGLVGAWPHRMHCLSSVLEHASVLRPLRRLQRQGLLRLDLLSGEELLCNVAVERRFLPETRLVVLTAASNVTGQSPDLVGIGRLCQQREAALVVDAALAAGSIPLDLDLLPARTVLAIAGHKGLYGPPGTGALVVGQGFDEEELLAWHDGEGGALSDLRDESRGLPQRLEAGTVNLPGFAGLSEGVGFVLEQGLDSLGKHKQYLVTLLIDLLCGIPGLRLYGAPEADYRCGILSFSLEGWDPLELSLALRDSSSIMTSGGLHNAPLMHRALGCPEGSLRVSVGFHNDEEEIIQLVQAVGRLAHLSALAA